MTKFFSVEDKGTYVSQANGAAAIFFFAMAFCLLMYKYAAAVKYGQFGNGWDSAIACATICAVSGLGISASIGSSGLATGPGILYTTGIFTALLLIPLGLFLGKFIYSRFGLTNDAALLLVLLCGFTITAGITTVCIFENTRLFADPVVEATNTAAGGAIPAGEATTPVAGAAADPVPEVTETFTPNLAGLFIFMIISIIFVVAFIVKWKFCMPQP